MDSDIWPSLFASAKHHLFRQQDRSSSSADRNGDGPKLEDFEAEVDARRDFTCPYCDKDHDIASLCAHLEDEHSLESDKVTVCPVCSFKVTRDLVDHITQQHGRQLRVQRRRKLHRISAPSSQSLSVRARDIKESYLQVLLGASGHKSASSTSTSELAEVLPSLAWNFDRSNIEEIAKAVVQNIEDNTSKNVAEVRGGNLGTYSFIGSEEQGQKMELDIERSQYVQHLLFSTLLSNEQDFDGV